MLFLLVRRPKFRQNLNRSFRHFVQTRGRTLNSPDRTDIHGSLMFHSLVNDKITTIWSSAQVLLCLVKRCNCGPAIQYLVLVVCPPKEGALFLSYMSRKRDQGSTLDTSSGKADIAHSCNKAALNDIVSQHGCL